MDGRVVVYSNGYKEWWVDGKRHRVDGPAIVHSDGYEEWWVDGKLHRVDGPAVVHPNGAKEWWVDSKRHRVDGPAIIYSNGHQEWWMKGIAFGHWRIIDGVAKGRSCLNVFYALRCQKVIRRWLMRRHQKQAAENLAVVMWDIPLRVRCNIVSFIK